MSKERECLVCGKKYKYCPHCNGNAAKEAWKATYCSLVCREIFKTCSNYEGELISQEDAYNKLVSLNVDSDNVTSSVKSSVKKIMQYQVDEAPVINEQIVENATSDVQKSVEVDTVDEQITYKRPRRRRSKYTEE